MVKIKYKDIDKSYKKLNEQINTVKSAISGTNASLNSMANTQGFEGITAKNMATYINRTDITNLRLISAELDALKQEYRTAILTFQGNVDSSQSAVLYSETINNLLTKLNEKKADRAKISAKASAANRLAATVMGLSNPSPSKMNEELAKAIKETKKTLRDLNEFNGQNFVKGTTKKITDINSKAINLSISKALAVGINRFTNKDLNRSTSKKYDSLAKMKDEKSLFTKAVENYTPKADSKKPNSISSKPISIANSATSYASKNVSSGEYMYGSADSILGWESVANTTRNFGPIGYLASALITMYNDKESGYDLNVGMEHFMVTTVATSAITAVAVGTVTAGLAALAIAPTVGGAVLLSFVVGSAVGMKVNGVYNSMNGNKHMKDFNKSVEGQFNSVNLDRIKKSFVPRITN